MRGIPQTVCNREEREVVQDPYENVDACLHCADCRVREEEEEVVHECRGEEEDEECE